jgi:hypothetical protein
MIAYIEDPVVIREILLTQMLFPRGTRQGTGWSPARNGADTLLAGEAMATGDDRMERNFGA